MFELLAAILILVVFLMSNKRYRQVYIILRTLPRDLRAAYRFLKGVIFIYTKRKESVPKIFTKIAQKQPNKVAFYLNDQTWTFKQLDEFSNKVAHFFKSKGYVKGNTVALLLDNRPEYVGIWLGLSKIGVVTALINTNLVADPLVHSLSVTNIQAVIFGTEFCKAITDIKDKIANLEMYEFGIDESQKSDYIDLKSGIKSQPTTVPKEIDDIAMSDKLLYIYTSGTTGLPKAATILNSRYMLAGVAVYYMANLSPNDIYYSPLPLYHSAGGMLAVAQALCFGIPVVLRKKFSASNFWLDSQKYNCTVANYIGEVCRYLLSAHKPESEVKHSIKTMVGNGLRPQIWESFRDTFKIKYIYEVYGATEGNSQMINIDGKVGAIGFAPCFTDAMFPTVLIRCNEDTGEPFRNMDGLCTRCKYGEAGLLVGRIDQKQSHKAFVGYADQSCTQKKLLKDVLVRGDAYFNTGDILVQDEFGYFYFKDRIGDTFRWKGENVATCEVEAVISTILDLRDVVSYGVQVPGTEGRAGMASIVDVNKTLDLKKLAVGIKSKLPGYAIPIFLRIMDSLPMTGTFKLKKVDLQKEGYDIEIIKDPVYFFNSKMGEYIPLTEDVLRDINAGRLL